MSRKCIYYVEGSCEKQLITALKENPAKLIPGRIRVFNVIQNLIPKSHLLSIQAGTTVALVFDTDVTQIVNIQKNIALLRRYCSRIKIVYLPQVSNLEDELIRCTDVKSVLELTRSNSMKNFKTDFCRLKEKDCRAMLERHKMKLEQLWTANVPEEFNFVEANSEQIKIN